MEWDIDVSHIQISPLSHSIPYQKDADFYFSQFNQVFEQIEQTERSLLLSIECGKNVARRLIANPRDSTYKGPWNAFIHASAHFDFVNKKLKLRVKALLIEL